MGSSKDKNSVRFNARRNFLFSTEIEGLFAYLAHTRKHEILSIKDILQDVLLVFLAFDIRSYTSTMKNINRNGKKFANQQFIIVRYIKCLFLSDENVWQCLVHRPMGAGAGADPGFSLGGGGAKGNVPARTLRAWNQTHFRQGPRACLRALEALGLFNALSCNLSQKLEWKKIIVDPILGGHAPVAPPPPLPWIRHCRGARGVAAPRGKILGGS